VKKKQKPYPPGGEDSRKGKKYAQKTRVGGARRGGSNDQKGWVTLAGTSGVRGRTKAGWLEKPATLDPTLVESESPKIGKSAGS